MRNRWMVAGALSCVLVTGVGLVLAAEEEEDRPVAKKDIPERVLETAKSFSDGAELDKCVLADEDGLAVYELHMKKGDRKIEVQTTKAGDLFATEEEVSADGVPELVKRRVAKLFTKGEKLSYERAVIVLYEVAAKDERGHEVEYLVNLSGAAFKELAGGIGEEEGGKKEEEKKGDKADRTFTEEFQEDEADLVSKGRNPYFILEPGYELVLEGEEKGEQVRLVITVLDETKKFGKIEARVVEERETHAGKLHEVARNYFAISKRTNSVFYLGEDVDNYDGEGEKVVNHEGSWLHGTDGAKLGLMMPGTVLLGARYYQERATNARDRAEVVSATTVVHTPAGKLENCLKVEETTPLEPGAREFKLYAPGIGIVKDDKLKLVRSGFARK